MDVRATREMASALGSAHGSSYRAGTPDSRAIGRDEAGPTRTTSSCRAIPRPLANSLGSRGRATSSPIACCEVPPPGQPQFGAVSVSDDRNAATTEVVLLSGGVDSATLAAQLLTSNRRLELLFVDYGHRTSAAERTSSRALAAEWGLGLTELTVTGYLPRHGEIVGRNALLVHLALAHRPRATRVHLGIHAGTGYRDCSPEFVELMQRSLDFHTSGETRLSAPFIDMS